MTIRLIARAAPSLSMSAGRSRWRRPHVAG